MALIYVAINKINGNRYIGVTTTSLYRRAYMHKWHARKHATNGLLHAAMRKYGEDEFEFSVLLDDLPNDDAMRIERAIIAELRPEYNIAEGGYGALGVKWSDGRRKTMTEALKAAWTQERRDAIEEKFGTKEKNRIKRERVRLGLIRRRPRRSVVHVGSGDVYSTIQDAAKAHDLCAVTVKHSCVVGTITRAGAFAFADEGRDAASEIGKRVIMQNERRLAASRARMRPVIRLNDGATYPSVKYAARMNDVTAMSIVQSCQSGAIIHGELVFAYASEGAPLANKHDKSPEQRTKQRDGQIRGLSRSWAAARKRVVCLDTNQEFDSISAAAKCAGTTAALVSAAIYRGGRASGRRFAFVGGA